MTVELDNVIKNLNSEALTIELFNEGGQPTMYIGTDSGSGGEYNVQSIQEVGEMLSYYLDMYYSG